MISLIAAVGKNRELGKNNQLLFHLKTDMQFFRETTTSHKVVMGRKTWESLPGKLPNRENIVISRHDFPPSSDDPNSTPDLIVHDLDQFAREHQSTPEEIFVIGGGMIYAAFLPYAKNLYLTEIDQSVPDADTFFPDFNPSDYSQTLIKKGKENDLAFSIFRYVKK